VFPRGPPPSLPEQVALPSGSSLLLFVRTRRCTPGPSSVRGLSCMTYNLCNAHHLSHPAQIAQPVLENPRTARSRDDVALPMTTGVRQGFNPSPLVPCHQAPRSGNLGYWLRRYALPMITATLSRDEEDDSVVGVGTVRQSIRGARGRRRTRGTVRHG
jgi:hypothetical protein